MGLRPLSAMTARLPLTEKSHVIRIYPTVYLGVDFIFFSGGIQRKGV